MNFKSDKRRATLPRPIFLQQILQVRGRNSFSWGVCEWAPVRWDHGTNWCHPQLLCVQLEGWLWSQEGWQHPWVKPRYNIEKSTCIKRITKCSRMWVSIRSVPPGRRVPQFLCKMWGWNSFRGEAFLHIHINSMLTLVVCRCPVRQKTQMSLLCLAWHMTHSCTPVTGLICSQT